MKRCVRCEKTDIPQTRRGSALEDLAHMVWHGYTDLYLIMDKDAGLTWWARIDGTEDVRAYAPTHHTSTPTRGEEKV